MTASIWKPGVVISDIDAEAISVEEYFTATHLQTLFTISNFVYATGSGNLTVYKNGALLTLGADYSETSSSSITLAVGAGLGDRIACILSAALDYASGSPAGYAAAAKAAADAAIYYSSIATDLVSQRNLQKAIYTTGVNTSGNTNAMTFTLTPVPLAYTSGFRFTFITDDGSNTISNPTVNLNGLGAVELMKRDSAGNYSALAVGDIVPHAPYDVVYNSGSNRFELMGVVPQAVLITFPEMDMIRQQVFGVI